jgi:hypothetical protein
MKFTKKSSNRMKIYLLVTSLLMTALSTPTLANFLSVRQKPAAVVAKPKPVVLAVAKPPLTTGIVKPLAKKKAKKVTKKVKVAKDSLAVDIDPTQASSPLYENNKNLELN